MLFAIDALFLFSLMLLSHSFRNYVAGWLANFWWERSGWSGPSQMLWRVLTCPT